MSVLWAKRGWMSGGTFVPHQLFTSGAQGAWYDPSDFSTLYQDAAGTTPVTAVEQPVRLMLDRSKGLVLGPELVANGDFSNGTTGWSTPIGATLTVISGVAKCEMTTDGAYFGQTINFVAGRTYEIVFSSISDGTSKPFTAFIGTTIGSSDRFSGTSAGLPYAFGVNRTFYYQAVATESAVLWFYPGGLGGALNYILADNISVRELPGNHASAPNDASRPVLRARYNLLTYTEQFDNAAWTKSNATITANAGVAPDGTTTADKMVPSTSNVVQQVIQSATIVAGIHTQSVYAKADGYSFLQFNNSQSGSDFANFDLSNGTVGTTGGTVTATITALANGWYRCIVTYSAFTAGLVNFRNQIVGSSTASRAAAFQGDGTSGILIWGAQLLSAADQAATGGAYQRVGAATDYDTSNPVWRPYLAFDGSDDSMSTSAIDFSGTDEVTVFAGVTRASSTSTGILTELSTSVTTVNGSFAIVDRGLLDATTNGDYGVRSRGTTTVSVAGTTLTVPTTSVLTMLSDISAPSLSLAVNGAAYASSTSTQGTGNFANAALFIGRRNNTSNPFNGRLYGLTVLGRTATAAELSAMETWINGKTGAY